MQVANQTTVIPVEKVELHHVLKFNIKNKF